MSTLYIIHILGQLHILSIATIVICIMLFLILGIYILVCFTEYDDKDVAEKCIKKYIIPVFIISVLFNTFIPSTQELYVIYGVGSAIDYIKQNPTAKQLPDKVVNLLDNMIDDSVNKEQKE